METKLYAGNLSFSTDEATLSALFAKFGEVISVSVIRDKNTGASKGFAFVTLSDQASAKKAIDALNAKEVDGRKIRVSIAQERSERSPHN